LGLSIVLRIVRESGGAVRVQSRPAKGTTFSIYLPASRLPAEPGEPSVPLFASRGSETILLAEDEDTVRRIMALMLQRSGYRVLEAADGEEALRIFREHESEIQLLLTDLVMPRLGGSELAARVHAGSPGLPVICMSGYSGDVVKRAEVQNPAILFVEKPLRLGALSAIVREALDSASRPFNPR
jgi:DNA-binding NtrC family response regulator